ncbi:MAG: leucyl/phenylalanyl-tRNA--protein transferase [Aestuariivita sp.]|nr:leucyl/phenylalanyl-tRNA--protein transferase [Aestuariivita sp.]MCY4203912.1 leucyl/phenylalanyl-tRNA--protein transferase [Aestuariivita sp.]MCY4287891.1 leucyl/phenylalanyl-tRNA--protein transferase [Aestuariivita sp.]MCY4345536.1 leucyl/phenylalanyl-tRNA--protein transferase [Aestuariivita sp.]
MTLSPENLLLAYSIGLFPMADDKNQRIRWYNPDPRAILPIGGFRMSRSLRRTIKKADFGVTVNADFPAILAGCADRETTWISAELKQIYQELHTTGYAHSLEVWQDGQVSGGVYGVALGAAFFAESMFSKRRDASKIALAYLVDRLEDCGFVLLDTQFLTPHLASLGGIEISREQYLISLVSAIRRSADFITSPVAAPHEVVQRKTQMS